MAEKVIGAASLQSKLSALTQNKGIIEGLNKAVARVEASARLNAPVDDGALRASITHEVDVAALQGSVGTPLSYAPYVEFGTGIFAKDDTGRKEPWTYKDEEGNWHTTAGQQPQPFLYSSLVSNKKKIISDIQQGIKEDLRGK